MEQKPKPGYKLVKWLFGKEIEIPKEWEISKLSKLCEKENDIVAGPFGSNLMVSDYAVNGVPIIRLQNIDRNQFIEKNIKFISKEKAEELKYHSYIPEDLILAKLGEPIGKTCKIPKNFPAGIVVADVVRIRTSPKKSDRDFVEYILNSWICSKQFNMERIGTTRPRVNLEQIRDLVFACPPLYEQQKIASILSTVDELINKYDAIINSTKVLKRGLMQQLLTKGIGHAKFKKVKWLFGKEIEIPEEWENRKISELGYIVTGSTPSTEQQEYYGNDCLWASPSDLEGQKYVQNTKAKLSKKGFVISRKIPKDSVLVVCIGSTIGKIGLSSKEMATNQQINSIICEDVNPEFVYYQLLKNNKVIQNMANHVAVPILNKMDFGSIRIVLPNKKTEQQKIASILSDIDSKISDLQSKKFSLEKLKKGLMQKLLTGKIRVPVS